MDTVEDLFRRFEQLNEIGAALSRERDIDKLLENILLAAKAISHADGGTLYRVTEDGLSLRFEIVRNDSLAIAMGGTSGNPIPFPPLPLRTESGEENNSMVAAYAAIHQETVQHRGRLRCGGIRLHGYAQVRREHRLPLAVLPHRADEESRERGDRRAAADQFN